MNIVALPSDVLARIFCLAMNPIAWPWSCLNDICRIWRVLCVSRQYRLWFVEHSTITRQEISIPPSYEACACAKHSVVSESSRLVLAQE